MKSVLGDYWLRFRDAVLTPARVVPLVTISVGSAVSYVVALAAKNGLNLDQGVVLGLALPVVLGAVGAALHWQVGNRQYEKELRESLNSGKK